MIITRISGGIGNQLFQYAIGRALSLKHNDELKLDTHCYDLNKEPGRSLTLYKFNISTAIATRDDFKKTGIPDPLKQNRYSKFIRYALRALESSKSLNKRKVILEPDFTFHPEIVEATGTHYLSGVWQSENYFKSIENVIRDDFKLKDPLSEVAQKVKAMIDSSTSVSVHIRRGDQVQNPELLKKHGELGDEYYQKAISYISEKTGSKNITLFIFSDDIAWVKSNMKFAHNVTYVSEYNLPDYEELTLMSYCKHNIIAKSSYSWWGAWLNQNPNKIITTPRKRFGTDTINDRDLIPESWVRI